MGDDEDVVAVARFDMDRAYYRAFVEDWVRHRSWFRRWELRLGILLIAFAFAVFMDDAEGVVRRFGLFCVGAGGFSVYVPFASVEPQDALPRVLEVVRPRGS